jgi:hypothetical protein
MKKWSLSIHWMKKNTSMMTKQSDKLCFNVIPLLLLALCLFCLFITYEPVISSSFARRLFFVLSSFSLVYFVSSIALFLIVFVSCRLALTLPCLHLILYCLQLLFFSLYCLSCFCLVPGLPLSLPLSHLLFFVFVFFSVCHFSIWLCFCACLGLRVSCIFVFVLPSCLPSLSCFCLCFVLSLSYRGIVSPI